MLTSRRALAWIECSNDQKKPGRMPCGRYKEPNQKQSGIMDDSGREFRVGLMVIMAVAVIVVMVFRFGEIGHSLKPGTEISIILPSASGVVPSSSVQLRGIPVGRVRTVQLLPGDEGVHVTARIDDGYDIPSDSTAQVNLSLLGDAVIELKSGTGSPMQAGDHIFGRSARDPATMMASVERELTETLASFRATGNKWGKLANNVNQLLEESGPDGVSTLQQTSIALQQFTQTMKAAEDTLTSASSLLNDPRYQRQLQATMAALPEMLNETQTTLGAVKGAVQQIDSTMATINKVASPLAQQSDQLVTSLSQSMNNVQLMTRDLAVVSRMLNREDGSLKKLMTDPTMYRNLDRTAASLSVLLEHLGPVVADLQVFSDKIARHPELLGVRGVMKGSSGLKNEDQAIRPAGFQRQNR